MEVSRCHSHATNRLEEVRPGTTLNCVSESEAAVRVTGPPPQSRRNQQTTKNHSQSRGLLPRVDVLTMLLVPIAQHALSRFRRLLLNLPADQNVSILLPCSSSPPQSMHDPSSPLPSRGSSCLAPSHAHTLICGLARQLSHECTEVPDTSSVVSTRSVPVIDRRTP
jgi:hypothetical protein